MVELACSGDEWSGSCSFDDFLIHQGQLIFVNAVGVLLNRRHSVNELTYVMTLKSG